ncbi:MAG: hypothetical protein K9K67_15735 [Bacteriovoracaceae bacterium]|nr:hypothetical protein [Bacteriovoracaceae bacterium]
MVQNNKDQLAKDKVLLEKKRSERQDKEKEARLEEHRRHLQEQMLLRQDYYSLTLFHKLIILVLFIFLFTFVSFLVLSYFPPTKETIFGLIELIL